MSGFIPSKPKPPKPPPTVRDQIASGLGVAMGPLTAPSFVMVKACEKALTGEAATAFALQTVEIDAARREVVEALQFHEAAIRAAAEATERLLEVTKTAAERLPADLRQTIERACDEGARRMAGGGKGMVAS